MFGQGDVLEKRSGKTMTWYRHATASEVTTTASESPTWAPQTFSVLSVTGQLAFYAGLGVEITELLEGQSVWEMRPDILQFNAEEAGRSINAVTRAALIAGTPTANVYIATGVATGSFTTAMTASINDITHMARLMKDQDAPTYTIGGQECYVAFISPAVEERLLQDSNFKNAVQYQQPQRLFNGFLAVFSGICFIRTSTANNATSTVNSITADNTIIVGNGAYGVPRMPLLGQAGMVPDYSGMAVGQDDLINFNSSLANMFQLVETMPGDGNGNGAHGDEYAAKHKATWKAFWNTVILNSAWIFKYTSAR
jgi:N4-gp56 family major capsid protein